MWVGLWDSNQECPGRSCIHWVSVLSHTPYLIQICGTAQLYHAPNITEKQIVRNAPDAIINMTAECRQKCQFESWLAIHSLGVNNYGSEYYVKSSHWEVAHHNRMDIILTFIYRKTKKYCTKCWTSRMMGNTPQAVQYRWPPLFFINLICRLSPIWTGVHKLWNW